MSSLAQMDTSGSSNGRLFLVLAGGGGLLITVAALLFTFMVQDPVHMLFQYVLTGQNMVVMIIWFFSALLARRILVGSFSNPQPVSKAMLAWGGTRISFLIALVILLVGLLMALCFDRGLVSELARAILLVLLVSALCGLIGQAIVNSLLVFRHWRKTARHDR